MQAAGRAGITSDVPPGARVWGMPAIDIGRARRNMIVGTDLYGLAKRVRQLERELERMTKDTEVTS